MVDDIDSSYNMSLLNRRSYVILISTQERGIMNRQCERGLDDRCRDQDGRIRQKNGNTRLDTLREIYGGDLARKYRGDMHLRTLLDRTGSASLSEYLRQRRRIEGG